LEVKNEKALFTTKRTKDTKVEFFSNPFAIFVSFVVKNSFAAYTPIKKGRARGPALLLF